MVTERSEKINGTAFTRGDYAIAIRWMERDESDAEARLAFMYSESADIGVLNATEIRAYDFKMEKSAVPVPVQKSTRSSRRKSKAKPLKPQTLQDGTYCMTPAFDKFVLGQNW